MTLIILALALLVGLSSGAHAAPLIPPSADTERIQSERERLRPDLTTPAPAPPVEQPAAPTQAMPADANKITFTLREIHLDGMTAYQLKALSNLWRDDIGKTIPLSRVYEIAARITERYRDDGYFLSRAYVPAQAIDKGIARIVVAEGDVTTVDFEGEHPPEALQRHFQKAILTDRPLNIKTVERQVLLLNDVPGMKFRTVLKLLPKEEGGGIMLALIGQTEKKWINTFVSYDNSGSRFLGPTIASARFTVARSGTPETTLAVSATPGNDEFQSGTLTETLPLTADGLKLALTAGYLRGAPGYTLTSSTIRSDTRTLGAQIIWEVVRQRTQDFNLAFGLEGQNSATDAFGLPLSRDSVRIAKLQVHADRQDSYSGVTIGDVAFSHGLEAWGASHAGDLNLSRASGRPDFLRLEASVYRLQELTGPWNALAGFSGQLADAPLLTGQQFGYGGQSFGRAYDSSELAGDEGAAAMAELRYEAGPVSDSFHFQHFVFCDYGRVWNHSAGQPESQSGASAGVGTRLKTSLGIDAAATVAQPLIRTPATPQFGAVSARAPRVSFSLTGSF